MKKILLLYVYLITVIFVVMPSLSYASLPVAFSIKSDLKLTDGTKVTGFLVDAGNGCKYSKEEKSFMVGDIWTSPEEGWVPLTDAFFLKRFIHKPLAFKSSKVPETLVLYKSIYKLNYLPKAKEKSLCDGENNCQASWRLAFWATLKSDEVEFARNAVKEARVLHCEEFSIAPVLTLDEKQIRILQKPAKAFFATEAHGMINIISYNQNFSDPKKLEDLFKDFVKTRKAINKMSLDEYKKELKAYLPEHIELLMYNVTD